MVKKKITQKNKKNKPVKQKPVNIKTVKAKPVKEKVVKKPRKPVVVCILTGQSFKASQAMLEKQAKKLKFTSVQDYVQYYVSKDARKLLKEGYTDIEIRNKHNCKDKTDLPMKYLKCYAPRIKNRARAKKREQRKALNEFLNDPNPAKYMLKPKGDAIFLDMTNPEDVAKLTYFACARPHIYLDNGRHCKGCSIYNLCKCPIKRIK
jgi:tRNA A58 N-methylase Trm61